MNSLYENETWPVFPKYTRKERANNKDVTMSEYLLRTVVRKKYNNKWYLIPVVTTNIGQDYISLFIEKVYRVMIFFDLSVAEEWIEMQKKNLPAPTIFVDEYQGSEEDRLKIIINEKQGIDS